MRRQARLLASGLLLSLAALPAAHAQPYGGPPPGPPPGVYGGPPPGPPGIGPGPGYHWHGRYWHHRRWAWDRYHRHHVWQYY